MSRLAPLRRAFLLFPLLLAGGPAAYAEVYPLPALDVDVIGEIQHTPARQEDTLLDIARRFGLGQDEIVMANPTVDRWMPGAGTDVLLPRQFVLPNAPRTGIVLNVPEMRLYYFRPKTKTTPGQVVTYPVSIGRMDWRTPMGTTRVLDKLVNPSWRPPKTIRVEHAAEGDILPEVVPPGPDNPLGRFALRLGIPGYLIHGTDANKEFGIGMRVTHGCVRMYPEDIGELFPQIPVGTPVHIVNQPVKMGWSNGTMLLEGHPPLDEDKAGYDRLLTMAIDQAQQKMRPNGQVLDGRAVRQALELMNGIPTPVSRVRGSSPPASPAVVQPPAPAPQVTSETAPTAAP